MTTRAFTVTVPGKPATGSFRFTKTGHRYTPQNVEDWKACVRLAIMEAMQEKIPEGCPVELSITVYKPKPATYPKKPTAKKPCPWAWVSKPDCDNVTKPTKDALKKLAFADDAQVTDLHVRKRWGPEELVEITVRPLEEWELVGGRNEQEDAA